MKFKKYRNWKNCERTESRNSPGCSSTLGHKKSTLVERQAPDAIATAVTATCVIADVTAPWTEPPLTAAAAAIALPEVNTELKDDETVNLGTIWSRTHRNFTFLRRPWQGKNSNNGFLRRINALLWQNIVEFWHEHMSLLWSKNGIKSKQVKESKLHENWRSWTWDLCDLTVGNVWYKVRGLFLYWWLWFLFSFFFFLILLLIMIESGSWSVKKGQIWTK